MISSNHHSLVAGTVGHINQAVSNGSDSHHTSTDGTQALVLQARYSRIASRILRLRLLALIITQHSLLEKQLGSHSTCSFNQNNTNNTKRNTSHPAKVFRHFVSNTKPILSSAISMRLLTRNRTQQKRERTRRPTPSCFLPRSLHPSRSQHADVYVCTRTYSFALSLVAFAAARLYSSIAVLPSPPPLRIHKKKKIVRSPR